MIQEVPKEHTLLVKGPSRVKLLEGKIEVFGKEFVPEKSENESVRKGCCALSHSR